MPGNYHQILEKEIEREFGKWSEIIKLDELDPNLWNPYTNWKEKAENITTAELEKFKSQLVSVLEEKIAENKKNFIQRIEDYLAPYAKKGIELNYISKNTAWKTIINFSESWEGVIETEQRVREEIEETAEFYRQRCQKAKPFIEKIQNHWKEKATEGKVNGKTLEEVLNKEARLKELEWKTMLIKYANNEELFNACFNGFITFIDIQKELEENKEKFEKERAQREKERKKREEEVKQEAEKQSLEKKDNIPPLLNTTKWNFRRANKKVGRVVGKKETEEQKRELEREEVSSLDNPQKENEELKNEDNETNAFHKNVNTETKQEKRRGMVWRGTRGGENLFVGPLFVFIVVMLFFGLTYKLVSKPAEKIHPNKP